MILDPLVLIALHKLNEDEVYLRVDRIVAVEAKGLNARVVLEGDWSFDVNESIEDVRKAMAEAYALAAEALS